MSTPYPVFDLPERLAAKTDPALIADDERHFAAIAATLDTTTTTLTRRLDELRRTRAGGGEYAGERDAEVRRVTRELAALRRYGLDLCIGRMVFADRPEPVYVGRSGMTDQDLDRLLVDWRSATAEPFFAASHGDPRGLVSRRRYRWQHGRIVDYWDEAFTDEGLAHTASLDDQSAFVASLGTSRSPRMRDVLGTIQADQDAVIRADSAGALVVDGGPGTGKTVVALHRAAYLLYADPRVAPRHGGVLFVGPTHAHLDYVGDVLPALGEDGVRLATLTDLVPEGAEVLAEADPDVTRVKAGAPLTRAVERAVRGYEHPPDRTVVVETDWADVPVTPDDWADAFDAADPGDPHNAARSDVWEALVEIVTNRLAGAAPPRAIRASVDESEALRDAFRRSWPLLDPDGVVADLLAVPDHLARCAPDLSAAERARLHRADARAWTRSDLPVLDAARRSIGDPTAAARERRVAAARAAERERMDRVIEDLVAADDSDLQLMSVLRGADARNSLDDDTETTAPAVEALAGPFAHVVVDEAQELTDAEWLMLLRRCPSRSFTIVGDRTQAREPFTESWADRLARIGLRDARTAHLRINYRTPSEVMAVAEPAIRAAVPNANVPTSIRDSGVPVHHGSADERDAILDEWAAASADGIACVIGDRGYVGSERIRSLAPEATKGLEFDLVVLVDPERWRPVDRYVAMTRATQRLVVLTDDGTTTTGTPVSAALDGAGRTRAPR